MEKHSLENIFKIFETSRKVFIFFLLYIIFFEQNLLHGRSVSIEGKHHN